MWFAVRRRTTTDNNGRRRPLSHRGRRTTSCGVWTGLEVGISLRRGNCVLVGARRSYVSVAHSHSTTLYEMKYEACRCSPPPEAQKCRRDDTGERWTAGLTVQRAGSWSNDQHMQEARDEKTLFVHCSCCCLRRGCHCRLSLSSSSSALSPYFLAWVSG